MVVSVPDSSRTEDVREESGTETTADGAFYRERKLSLFQVGTLIRVAR